MHCYENTAYMSHVCASGRDVCTNVCDTCVCVCICLQIYMCSCGTVIRLHGKVREGIPSSEDNMQTM